MASPLLHYRIDGTGPMVALLHPVGLDLTFFDPLVAELDGEYQILRMDLRGHGRTQAWAPTRDLAEYAEDVHELLLRGGYVPLPVVGFSFGGMLAQILALEHPADVTALVLAACPSTLPESSRAAIAGRGILALQGGMQAVVDATLERWFTPTFRAAGHDAASRRRLLTDDVAAWASAWNAIAAIHLAPRLAAIQVPTLCLAGEFDASTPPAVVEAIAREIPRSQFAVIAGAPHMLFIEQPRAVADKIRGFLAQVL